MEGHTQKVPERSFLGRIRGWRSSTQELQWFWGCSTSQDVWRIQELSVLLLCFITYLGVRYLLRSVSHFHIKINNANSKL